LNQVELVELGLWLLLNWLQRALVLGRHVVQSLEVVGCRLAFLLGKHQLARQFFWLRFHNDPSCSVGKFVVEAAVFRVRENLVCFAYLDGGRFTIGFLCGQ
jgi:hypothetical protein